MGYSVRRLCVASCAALVVGCSDDVRTITVTPIPSPTSVATPIVTEMPPGSPEPTATAEPIPTVTDVPASTPTGTPSEPAQGPVVTYIGITTAASRPIESEGADAAGRPVYVRALGAGLGLVIEARSGIDGRPVGPTAFNPGGLPDLQVLLSRPLGDGGATVCDIGATGPTGGVPAVDPPVFADNAVTADAINDLGCRVNDGTGAPLARQSSAQACTQFRSGAFSFVDPTSTAQFCLPIARTWDFPVGDTVVTARVRGAGGVVGDPVQVVVRILRELPTLGPTATPGIPGPTPIPPRLTYLGIAAADDAIVSPSGTDGDGRPVFNRLFGSGVSLIIEAAPGEGGGPVGNNAFGSAGELPDLQVLVDRDLGDGDPRVCDVDIENRIFGGVPGTSPLEFSTDPAVIAAINDLGCRVNDGTGAPLGRRLFSPCTRDAFGNFTFVDPDSTIQFCLPIASAWEFQPGDTRVAARVRGHDGGLSAVEEMVVHVDGNGLGDCELDGLGARVFSVDPEDSDLFSSAIEGDVSTSWRGDPALLCAGPGEGGVYPLRLLRDFSLGLRAVSGDIVCIAFSADGSGGTLDCAGTEPLDVTDRVDGATGERESITRGGMPSGVGAAILELDVAFVQLGAGSTLDDCRRAVGTFSPTALTTANGFAEVVGPQGGGVVSLSVDGENFDCDNWSEEDGAGRLVLPLAVLATEVGDIANAFVLDD